MKILYFYQYFSTDKGSWGTRVYDFTKEWVKAGHRVIIVTSIYAKSDIESSRYRLVTKKNIEGLDIIIINININNKHSFIRRLFSFIGYAVVSSYYALVLSVDIVISSSGPITVGIPGLVARYLRKRKFVFEVRDLWPQGAIELGIIKNKYFKKITYWFEKRLYFASDLIVTLSPGMVKDINQRFKLNNIISITNAVSIDLFSLPKTFVQFDLITPRKYVIYTGNIGIVNNSMWLIDAARILEKKGRTDIKILVIGDGPMKKEMIKITKDEKLGTIVFKDLSPKNEIVPFVQHAIASLVPLKSTPILDTSSPNKLFESIAAGVPVIQNTNGWIKDFLNENRLGFTIDPSDAESLVEKIIELDAMPSTFFEVFARHSKAIAEREFDKKQLSARMLSSIEKLIDK